MGNFDKLVIDKKRCSIQITGKDESGCVNTINHTTTPAANRLALTRLNTNDRKIRNDEIIRMYNQGYTQTAIAAETGLSQSGVHNILKKAGVI
jgi:DNA-binding NarL/FixJ family response regulator